MRLFINRVFLFFAVMAFLCFGLMFFVNSWLNQSASFIFSEDNELVVFGNSHSECSYNDKYIENFSNFSASGESYFYTYFKAQQILSQNSHLKIVFIEFSNSQINEDINEWIWSDKHLSARYHIFSPFMKFKDHWLLFKNNKKGLLKYLHIATEKNLKRIKNSQYDYISKMGKYKALIGISKEMLNKEHKPIVEYVGEMEFSDSNIFYLKQLVQYFKKENIKFYFIRSPLHKNNTFQKNELFFIELLENDFNEVEFLDFVDFPLETSDFYDFGHLNEDGAKKFSKWFNELLEEGLLDKQDKQDFINKQMKAFEQNLQIQ